MRTVGLRNARGFARYNTPEDGARAIHRAERWLKNQSKGPNDKPPFHILMNAHLADQQFGKK